MESTNIEKIENIKTKLKELTGGSKGGNGARANNNNLIPQRRVERAPEVTQDELEDLEAALLYTIFDLPEGPLQDTDTGGFVLGMIIREREDVIGRLTRAQREGIINIIERESEIRRGVQIREHDQVRMQEIINSLRESLIGIQGGKRRKGGKRKTVKANKSKKRRNKKGGMYRSLHQLTLGRPSRGHQKEIDSENAAAKIKRDSKILDDIRNSKNYDEVHDIDDLVVGGPVYVEFQGADAKPILKNLGQFKKEWHVVGGMAGVKTISIEFDKKTLYGFYRLYGYEAQGEEDKSLTGKVFKVNSGNIAAQHIGLPEEMGAEIGEYGGRKSKRRRSIKKQKKTKMSRGKKGGMYRKSSKKQ